MEEKDIVAANLNFYRKKAGFSQLDLAKKLNYSNKNISKWENGETTPNIFILKKIADLYGITVDDLLCADTAESSLIVETKVKLEKRHKSIFNLFMLILANAIMFAVASLVIYILGIVNVTSFNKWLIYLYFTPLCFLSIAIYVKVLYKFAEIISISAIGWLVCLSVYLSLLPVKNIELIFILGAAYQFVVLCIAILINIKSISRFAVKLKKLVTKNKTKNQTDVQQ